MTFDTMKPVVQDLMNSSIWDEQMFVNGWKKSQHEPPMLRTNQRVRFWQRSHTLVLPSSMSGNVVARYLRANRAKMLRITGLMYRSIYSISRARAIRFTIRNARGRCWDPTGRTDRRASVGLCLKRWLAIRHSLSALGNDDVALTVLGGAVNDREWMESLADIRGG